MSQWQAVAVENVTLSPSSMEFSNETPLTSVERGGGQPYGSSEAIGDRSNTSSEFLTPTVVTSPQLHQLYKRELHRVAPYYFFRKRKARRALRAPEEMKNKGLRHRPARRACSRRYLLGLSSKRRNRFANVNRTPQNILRKYLKLWRKPSPRNNILNILLFNKGTVRKGLLQENT